MVVIAYFLGLFIVSNLYGLFNHNDMLTDTFKDTLTHTTDTRAQQLYKPMPRLVAALLI